MELFGYGIEQIYLLLLIIGVVLTLIYVFVGELLEGLFEMGEGSLNPISIIGFITLLGGLGYIFERFTGLGSGLIFFINFSITLVVTLLINFFIVLPLKKAEKNTSYSIKELKGSVGEVFTTIPATGFGEIIISRVHGTVSKPAKSFDGVRILEGTKVLVIDIDEEGVFLVSEHYD